MSVYEQVNEMSEILKELLIEKRYRDLEVELLKYRVEALEIELGIRPKRNKTNVVKG